MKFSYYKIWNIVVFIFLILLGEYLKQVYGTTSGDVNNDIHINRNVSPLKNKESMYTLTPLTTPATNPDDDKPPKWLIYCSAVPTIFVFLVALVVIAVKNRYDENDDVFDPDDTDGLLKLSTTMQEPRKKPKRKNEEIYDAMLQKFKEDKTKKQAIVGRKSSQIRIEGIAGRSPKSLARKHILIGKLNQDDVQPDGNESALGQLVQLSTHTFIGSTIVDDIKDENDRSEGKAQLKQFVERSRENIADVIKILPDDVNRELLPEDLEDAFRDFSNWEESLL